MKLNIIAGAIVAFCIAVVAYVKHVSEMSEECKRQGAVLDERERNRKIMEKQMEELSEQLLEFVFDTSKVAKPVFEDDFQKLLSRVFWSLPDEEDSHVYVEGLNYEVGEHVVIKSEEAEVLMKVVGIVKVDKINESTELVCEYVSWRKKKDRHSYADLYKMSYLMQCELDNVKEVVLNQNTMRRHEIEDLEKELKELVSDMQDKLTKESQEYGKWTQELVDAVTVLLEGKIKQLDKEVKELRREVTTGVDK